MNSSSKSNRNGKSRFQRKKPNSQYLKPVQKHEMEQDKRIEQLHKKIKEIGNEVELKYFDVLVDTTIPNTGVLSLLNGMATGDTQITRTGGQIKITSVQYRIQVFTDQDSVGFPYVRFSLFWDRQANGAAPTVASDPLVAGTPALYNSALSADFTILPIQYESIQRYSLIEDKIMAISPGVVLATDGAGATTDLVPVGRMIQGYHKLSRQTKYDTAAAGIASITTNSLYAVFSSDLASEVPFVNGVFRIYFRDA